MSDIPVAKRDPSKLLIVGGIALLVVLLGVGGGAYGFVSSAASAARAFGEWLFHSEHALVLVPPAIQEPTKVAELVREIAPGAKIPEGYQGAVGYASDQSRIAVIAPPGCLGSKQDGANAEHALTYNVLVIARSTAEVSGNEDATTFAAHGDESPDRENLEPETIRVGGQDVVFKRCRISRRVEESGRQTAMLQYLGSWPVPGRDAVTIMMTGPEATFDRKAMDAFLGSIGPAGK